MSCHPTTTIAVTVENGHRTRQFAGSVRAIDGLSVPSSEGRTTVDESEPGNDEVQADP